MSYRPPNIDPAYFIASASLDDDAPDGTAFPFDTLEVSNGSKATVDTVTNVGRFTLEPGRYLVDCSVRMGHPSTGSARHYQLYDVTNTAYVSGTQAHSFNGTASGPGGNSWLCAVIDVAETTEFEIHNVTSTSNFYLKGGEFSRLLVVELQR